MPARTDRLLFLGILVLCIFACAMVLYLWHTKLFGFTTKKAAKVTWVHSVATQVPTPTAILSPRPIPSPTPAPKVFIKPTATAMPTVLPFVTSQPATPHASWEIRSVDAMKATKDAVCSPKSADWINQWLDKAGELGANYIAISTPYDNPSCADSVSYTKRWVQAIRAHGMHVWHRHMPLAFEGIFGVQKNASSNFLDLITQYILTHPDLFQSDDILTPIPEPQNGGIAGVTNCADGVCQFRSAAAFNQWLRDAMTTVNTALEQIGESGKVKVGYFGFDGFVTWGDSNPDWHGILEDSTVSAMGNITIDHYPELVHETMSQSLSQLSAKYPDTPIVIGEWGTVTGGDTVGQIKSDMGAAAQDKNVIGFNYWQFGPDGSGEQLIDNSFSNLPGFAAVATFYK